MIDREILRHFVDLALPKPCEFAEENFAGDPLVQEYFEALRELSRLDMLVYVAWSCPPDVMAVRSAVGNALIRSERLDTLLVEYVRLQSLHRVLSDELAREVTSASVLRWLCELLIGFREPGLAVYAHTIRPDVSWLKGLTNPFRDETLASLPLLERTALQCFCLGHEVGHLTAEKQNDVTLEATVDGLSLLQHMDYDYRSAGVSEEMLVAFHELWNTRIDAANLLDEVHADLFAFHTVVDFISSRFRSPLEDVIRATLRAFEALLFVYACKHTCRLVKRAISEQLSQQEFRERHYLDGLESIVRARATVRRAGLLWATMEHGDSQPGVPDYAAYVKKIDQMLTPTQGFTNMTSETLTQYAQTLFAEIDKRPEAARHAWSEELLALVEQGDELRLDLFFILVAFGCPGGTDVVAYLRSMQSRVQPAV